MIPIQPFGRTGHDGTRIIFGAAALWGMKEAHEAAPALDLLLRHGINHIDTAASYGRSERRVGEWMPEHRARFFLATKTNERTYDGARAQIEKSLERLQTDHVDLLQLHNLVDEDEWRTALGPGGALEAAVEARDAGKTRFIGVTGHGVTVAGMHVRSLERFAFDSVLLPYNPMMMRNAQYAADFERLAVVCAERGVAMQTIKGVTRRPWDEREGAGERGHSTWYEPLTEQGDIDLAVRFVLGRPNVFLNTASDVSLLAKTLDAAERGGGAPSDGELSSMIDRQAMAPLFT
jgi:aryl-alcohol dehydrogenase-like predicted oxidoreductase